MKLLITGGCGFLGSNLGSDALRHGDDLVIFDNLERFGSTDNLSWLRSQGNFNFLKGDIRDYPNVESVIKDFVPDVIFHLAGQVAMTNSIESPRHDFEVNAVGSFNVLEAVRRYAPKALVIYSSTNKVYGDLEQYDYTETDSRYICDSYPKGFDELVALNFHSPYGCSKGSADQYMLDFSRVYGVNTVVFRHSSMYGGRQFSTYSQGWVGWFSKKALEFNDHGHFEPITILGSGKQVRDLLHVDDVKTLYRACINNSHNVKGHAFNIGGGIENSLSILELFSLLENILEKRLRYRTLESRPSDQRVFISNTSKAQRFFNWVPKVGVNRGISDLLDWLKSMSG